MLSFSLFLVDIILVGFISLYVLRFFDFFSVLERYILFVILFCATIIFTAYSLSIFKLISAHNFIIFHFIFFCLIFFIKHPQKTVLPYQPILGPLRESIGIKNNPLIAVLVACLGIFLLASFISGIMVPPNNWDGMSYHLSRVGYWLQNKSLGIYVTQDTRQLYLLPNAEILILWSMAFLKMDLLAFMPQYISYIAIFVLVFLFSRFLEFKKAPALFAALLWSSVTETMLEATSVQNDLVVTFFMFAGVYFFLKGLKNCAKSYLFASAIALGLSLGTKATSLFVFPGLLLSGFLIIFYHSGRRSKLFFYWFIYVFFSFLLFGSYMYFQNFMSYGFFLGPKAILEKHSTFSVVNAANNLIHIGKRFFDTSGLTFLKIPHFYQGVSFHEDSAGYGLVWVGLILPAAIYCLFKTRSMKKWLVLSCGSSFLFFFSASLLKDPWIFRLLIPFTAFVVPLSACFYQPTPGLNAKSKFHFIYLLIFVIFSVIQTLTVAFCNPSKPIYVLPSLQERKVFKNYLSFFQMDSYEKRYLPFSDLKLSEMAIYHKLDEVSRGSDKIAIISSGTDWDYPAFGASLQRHVFPIIYSTPQDVIEQLENHHVDYLLIFGPIQKFENFNADLSHLIALFIEKKNLVKFILQNKSIYLFDVRSLR